MSSNKQASNSNAHDSSKISVKPRIKKNWIPVSAGLLKKDNMILVGQRPENHTLAGLWEFPG
ncbi:MAG: 8-oxo-dGTP diphosphatase MutT, partial [Pseudobdellovibrio sp.]